MLRLIKIFMVKKLHCENPQKL